MNVGDLLVTVGAKIDGFKTAMGDVSSTATGTANTASAAASKINQVFSAAFGAGVTALAFSAANKFESAFAQIQRSTGATEEKLKGLEESFTNVYKKTAAGSEEVAAAISILSTRTQATGKDLEDLTLKTIKLAKTQREDLGTIVPLITRAFGDWSIASNQQAKAMDYMRTVSQTTGTSVARLAEQVVFAGAPLRQLGYNFEQSTALIGKFEKEGVNTELVLGGMKAALQKFAKDGVTDTAAAWQEFVAGVRSGNVTLQDVMKEVGAKRGVDLYRAITEGRFEIDEMVKSAKKLADEGGAGIETMKTKIVKLQHEVEAVVAGHYQIITAIGLTWPLLTVLGGGFGAMAKGAVAGISTITTALQFGLVGALTAVEFAALAAGSALAAMAGGAVDAGLAKIQNSTTDDKLAGAIIGVRTGLAVATGSVAPPVYKFGNQKGPNANDYVNSLPAPKGAGTGTPKPGAGGGGDAGEASHEFTILASLKFDQAIQQAARFKQLLADFFAGGANYFDALNSSLSDSEVELRKLNAAAAELPVEMSAAGRAATDALSTIPPEVLDAANEMARLARDTEIVSDAYHQMGLKTPKELESIAEAARENYEIIKGAAGDSAIAAQVAWQKSVLAQIELDYQLGDIGAAVYAKKKKDAEDALAAIEGKTKESTNRVRQYTWSAADDMKRAMSGAFDATYRMLGDSLGHWKGFGEAAKGIVQNLASDMTSTMLKAFFQPIEKAAEGLAKSIGGALDGLLGIGTDATKDVVKTASGAASGASGAASAAGGAASSGVAGIVSAVSGVVSAVSGVIGNFQFMGMNKSLDVLVNHTLRTFNELAQFRIDAWDREAHLMTKLDDIWRTLLDTYDLLGRGAAPMAAAPGNITIQVQGAGDPGEVARHVVSHLKRNGVYV